MAPRTAAARLTASRATTIIAFSATALVFALPFRQPDCNTASHFALVQQLASGRRNIDSIRGESCDVAAWHGHWYSNKAPGLAFVTLPWYELLRTTGVVSAVPRASTSYPTAMRSIPRRDLWLLGLWGAVLPALGTLLVVSHLAERVERGVGTSVAVSLGLATLLLPFASLFFSHALAALVAVSAFALCMARRFVLAGLLAGFGIVVEYPLALLAAALAAYVVAVERRRAPVFVAAFACGTAPLLIYNTWVYGAPWHISYSGALRISRTTGHEEPGANSSGFFGVGAPRLHALWDILGGPRGLVSLAPLVALALAGAVLLWRRGLRRQIALGGTIVALYLLYDMSYYSPLGGATPGPRFLVCILGVVAVAFAPVARAAPRTFAAFALASTVSLGVGFVTQPLISPPYTTSDWWTWFTTGHFTSTIADPTGHGALGAALIGVVAGVAFLAAWAGPSSPIGGRRTALDGQGDHVPASHRPVGTDL